MRGPGAGCRLHRPVLVDLVDRGERGPATPAALDHLAACRPCEREVTELALTIAALRRAGSAYRALPVPEAAPAVAPFSRTLARARRGPDWSRRLQLGSLLTSAGIAAMLVAPHVGLMPEPPISDAAPATRPAAVITWQQAEQRLTSTPDPGSRAVVALPPRYPEGLSRPWKEVPATDASHGERERASGGGTDDGPPSASRI